MTPNLKVGHYCPSGIGAFRAPTLAGSSGCGNEVALWFCESTRTFRAAASYSSVEIHHPLCSGASEPDRGQI
jgi:hypothetical protein